MNLGAENNRFDTIFCNTLDVENGVMGGGGVKQLELYSGTSAISAITGSTNYILSDSTTNYDYLVVKIIANEVDAQTEKLILVDASSTKLQEYSGNTQAQENSRFNGWFVITNPTTLTFALRYRGTNVNSVCLASVVGIKYIDPDIKNATSLDETLLYSGNDHITNVTATNSYIMVDTIDNYNYLLVTIKTYRTGVEDATTIIIEDEDKYYSWETNYSGNSNPSRFSAAGFVHVVNNTLEFGLRYIGSDISYAYISSVIGIKKKSLSTADIAEMAMPSDIYSTITLSATTGYFSGATNFTAPANGWVEATVVPSGSNTALLITASAPIGGGFGGGYRVTSFVPVKKGDEITIYMEGGASSSEAKFFYTIGDVKALGLDIPTIGSITKKND